MAKEQIVNFDSAKEKALMLEQIRLLRGSHRVTIIKHCKRRSDRQNRWYWPAFVQVFGDYLRGQGDAVTDQDVHLMLRNRFLRETVYDRRTGEVAGDYAKSTTELSTVEFNEYLDRICAWLGEMFGIRVPDPSEYREPVADEESEPIGALQW